MVKTMLARDIAQDPSGTVSMLDTPIFTSSTTAPTLTPTDAVAAEAAGSPAPSPTDLTTLFSTSSGSPPTPVTFSTAIMVTALEYPTELSSSHHGPNTGVIAGAVVGGVVGALLLLACALAWWKGLCCFGTRASDEESTITPFPPPTSRPGSHAPSSAHSPPHLPHMLNAPTASRVSFATERTSRTVRSSAPSPSPGAAEYFGANAKPSCSAVDDDIYPEIVPGVPAVFVPGHTAGRHSLDTVRTNYTAQSELHPGSAVVGGPSLSRPASRASLASRTSRISKISRLSKNSIGRMSGLGLSRAGGNSNPNLKYTTTTERLRDRPFSTIYDADSAAWGDVANLRDLSDSESEEGTSRRGDRDGDHPFDNHGQGTDGAEYGYGYALSASGRGDASGHGYGSGYDYGDDRDGNPDVSNVPEVTVQDPSLHSHNSSGTPTPPDTLGRSKSPSTRERLHALMSGSQASLRRSAERDRYGTYTVGQHRHASHSSR